MHRSQPQGLEHVVGLGPSVGEFDGHRRTLESRSFDGTPPAPEGLLSPYDRQSSRDHQSLVISDLLPCRVNIGHYSDEREESEGWSKHHDDQATGPGKHESEPSHSPKSAADGYSGPRKLDHRLSYTGGP